MIVAIAVLVAVIVPVTILVYNGQNASNQLRLRAEATDIASQELQKALYGAAFGGILSSQTIQLPTVYSGRDPFNVAITYAISYEQLATSVCTDPVGGNATGRSDIFTLTAVVTWGHTGGLTGRVVQTTNLAPPSGEFPSPNATEVAVPIYDPTTGKGVTASLNVQLSCTLDKPTSTDSDCASDALQGYTTAGNAQTQNGCAVFTDAWAGKVEYTVQAIDNPGWVAEGNYSDQPTAPGLPTISDIVPVPDGVATAVPGFTMTWGTNTSVNFASMWSPTTTPLPVTVIGDNVATTLGLSSGFSTAAGSSTDALLYPVSGGYQAWAGSQAAGNPQEYGNFTGAYGPQPITTPIGLGAASVASATLPLFPLDLDFSSGVPSSL
ncbi:MAG TPA: hypothetical protein VMD59_18195, partial [Acidimicrobiales bacterium]|nr:hypothetical protein [Acidimicrobiales bacterium]